MQPNYEPNANKQKGNLNMQLMQQTNANKPKHATSCVRKGLMVRICTYMEHNV